MVLIYIYMGLSVYWVVGVEVWGSRAGEGSWRKFEKRGVGNKEVGGGGSLENRG